MADRDYFVTARKYRPSLFKEVVAQGHVTETLKNAIELDRLAHAYLFSGPRGVGKTTAARILAKAINCETPREEREDGAEPCCECDSCISFEEGRSLNVFEMDAASNNKVDDVRELREKVRIPPQGENKKVYILDEVHMLSKQAFNALLKTLEEPPAHALFIFATTEPHKVLPTILSRCQRFDFRRIPVPKIVDRLREICENEGVEADEESLMLLARKGDGALRDALSAFDQAISLCGTTLKYGELTQALGVVDQDLYFDLTDCVATQDTAAVLELVQHIVRSGYDLQEFLVGLAEHLRNLLVVHSLGSETLEGVAESTRRQYDEAAEPFGEADLLRLLTVVGDAQDDVKNSPQPRLKLETTLLKMTQMRSAADLRDVLQKIDRLEAMVEAGDVPASLDASGESTESRPPNAADDGQNATAGSAEPGPQYGEPDDGVAVEGSEPEAEAGPPSDASREPKTAANDGGEVSEGAERVTDEDDTEDDGSVRGDDGDAGVGYDDLFGAPALEKGDSSESSSGGGTTDARGGAGSSGQSGTGAEAAVAEPPGDADAAGADGLVTEWPAFVDAVKSERISLGSLLGETEPVKLSDGVLTVAVPKPLHRETLRTERRFLVERLSARFDQAVEEVEFVVDDTSDGDGSDADEGEPLSPREKLQALRETYASLDVLFEEFGAEPVW